MGCTALKGIKIPSGVTKIDKGAFAECPDLESISVDKNNKVYDSRNNCNAIIESATNTLITGCKTTVIPENVTSIDWCAFDCCSGLTEITIPASVTSIGFEAFHRCDSLTDVYYAGNIIDKRSIEVEGFNEALLNATWHYGKESTIFETIAEFFRNIFISISVFFSGIFRFN